jgi:hypothetical protein
MPSAGFPVRMRIAIPLERLGSRLDKIIAWLDANRGFERSISRPSSFVFGETTYSASARGSVIEREDYFIWQLIVNLSVFVATYEASAY